MLDGRISRDDLEKELKMHLPTISYTNKMHKAIVNDIVNNTGFDRGEIAALLTTKITPLTEASDIKIYYIAKYAYRYSHIESLDPKNYFTEQEIFDYDRYSVEKESDYSKVVELMNMQQVNANQYTGVISLQEIYNLFEVQKAVTYNMHTQREPITFVVNDEVYKKVNVNNRKVNKIKETLLENMPITNTLTLNILVESEEGKNKFEYDKGSKTLRVEVVKKVLALNIIDGYHRCCGITKAIKENPNLNYNFIINVYNYNYEDAKRYVRTTDMQTPMNKLHVNAMNDENPYMVMAHDINRKDNKHNNQLFNKICEDVVETINENAHTTFDILSKAINYNFDEKNKLSIIDRSRIKNFIVEGMNFIIGTYEKDFKNKTKSRLTSYVTEPTMFIVYVAILSTLYNTPDWDSKLIGILDNKISFDKDNDLWKNLDITNTRMGSKFVKNISDTIKSMI